jgi:hypothetical protein
VKVTRAINCGAKYFWVFLPLTYVRGSVALFQLDGPISVVEKLLPTVVTLMAEMKMDKRIVFRLEWLLDKGQSSLLWRSATLFHVAFRARTNNIFPSGFAAHTPWDNVVKRQLAGGIAFAAILTFISIASKDVSAIKFHFVSRQTVVK